MEPARGQIKVAPSGNMQVNLEKQDAERKDDQNPDKRVRDDDSVP